MNHDDLFTHIPVLLTQVMEGLRLKRDGTYLDGTFGRGGHARAMLGQLGPNGRLLLMYRDPEAIANAQQSFASDPRVSIRQGNFAELADWSQTEYGLDGVLLDLGVSSPQLDDARRGFSFMADGPLDMRMDPGSGVSVAQFLAEADEEAIATVLWNYGDERRSRRIARAVGTARQTESLQTTSQLAELVAKTIGYGDKGRHPATRAFQALRIHVNDEMGALHRGLRAALTRLKPGGRLAVISFHSLEDRAVKRFIKAQVEVPSVRRGLPQPTQPESELIAIGKAQFADEIEVSRNPRSRSAVLRIAERIAEGAA
ncbi:MAG: 16S rRNA (cytosine(1402)-N(4))-methyltransferase RsmH [Dokdonella sp.]